ncbi:sorbitol dehydrogenase family protein [Serratia plymuthica]|uniref:Membrane bound FAD containing D-sorbitol dehydrogenase n=1 Tax=Serratia plymuthica TaxID=82996 RepID=A0A2X4UYP3_SERPL|nr:sorbitol dehydrogenase family protein [Serratia plymuthica]QPS19315.1 sorbitol dehydrogenase family protein [Serratia plymuthica]QPS61026.1 sorbitol dehydrogenase family protein [Serratia plymuthica]RKS61914.1 D-sorbitol dehydrogenase-like protein [Serratia plymuthica]UNK29082.1 sorbitol dehydrogenase family protein [Serratia plymuthica]CAI2513782.1 Membrane bound FAD containing D-sorbitol dehydrogenase [Serratia plymuthica]
MSTALPSENLRSDNNGTGFRRRDVLFGMASVLVATSLLGYPFLTQAEQQTAAANPLVFARFFTLSRTITEHQDIDQGMSARIFTALSDSIPNFSAQIKQLSALLQPEQSAKQLQTLAIQTGLQDLLTAIISAWYTGTVGHGPQAVLIAYKDALMYRPASDALIVPTYCGNGPLWWTAAPPMTMTPVR